jgi:quercetin dioxygenase-like cupin family protein
MAVSHAQAGDVVDVRPLSASLVSAQVTTLVKTDDPEIVPLIVTAGKVILAHRAPGELVVQCAERRIAFACLGSTREIETGDMLFLPKEVLHSVLGIVDGSPLLTVLLPKKQR